MRDLMNFLISSVACQVTGIILLLLLIKRMRYKILCISGRTATTALSLTETPIRLFLLPNNNPSKLYGKCSYLIILCIARRNEYDIFEKITEKLRVSHKKNLRCAPVWDFVLSVILSRAKKPCEWIRLMWHFPCSLSLRLIVPTQDSFENTPNLCGLAQVLALFEIHLCCTAQDY